MKCEEVKRLLTEEEADRADEIQRHLASCESCRRLSDDLSALKALSGELKEQAKAPDFFATRVCTQVGSRRARLAYVGLAGVAVTGLALCLAYIPGLTEFSIRQAPSAGVVTPANSAVFIPGEPAETLVAEDLRWADEYRDNSSTVSVVVREKSSAQYILEVPATIEVRQTQAENEFYLKNVSH